MLSVASNVHLKSRAQQVVEALKDKVKRKGLEKEEVEEYLTAAEAIG